MHELILWIETIENEEYIDHEMVSLFRHLHSVTKNCANINNTDQNFPGFSNRHIFYDNYNDEHLPILVYSVIKPSIGPEVFFSIPYYVKTASNGHS